MSAEPPRLKPRQAPADGGAELVANAAIGLAGLDRLVHEPARLAILALLAVVEEADFVFLQRHAELTAGNLATHLARLEQAGLVRTTKTFAGRRPCTRLALTEPGRTAFAAWRKRVGRLIDLLE